MITRFNQRRVLFLIIAALITATFAAYEPMRHNGFVKYDDYVNVVENPNVNGGITRDSVIWAFTKSHMANWHPLTWLSHMLDCRLFGLNPFWHHLINLLFHIANALLLFWILNSLTGALWPSAFVAAVFALHPLQVESVAWVAERKTVLSGLFWFLTIAVYIWYTKRPGIGRYTLLFVIYALCVMTKPVVVTLPLVLLLLDYWPLERLNWRSPPAGKTVSAGRLLIEKVPLLVLSAILCVITLAAQQSGEALSTLEAIPLEYRIANTFISYIRYIWKMIWPSGLAVIYPFPYIKFSNAAVAVCMLLFVLITVFSIYIGRRRKYAAVGWLWYVGTLVPMAGLIQAGKQGMADRYMYISMLGLLIIAAWAVKDLIANRPRWKVITAALAGVVLLSAVILTRMQVRHWQNSMALFEYALKVTENNAVAEHGYGCALYEAGRLNEAVPHLSKAAWIDPAVPKVHNNLGRALLKQGRLNEAIACLNEALRIDANQPDVHANLGIAYSRLGKYEPAIQNWTKVAELKPDNADALNNLAWLLATAGNTSAQDADKAIKLAQRACELTGHKDAGLLDTLAAAYAAGGRFDDAVTTASQAVDAVKATDKELNVSEIQERIKLYQTGQRYRQK